jgi:hypothetical protein
MKKLLILIVFAAVYLHFYPQPKLTQWFEQQKKNILTDVANATDTKVRLKADKIFSDLVPDFKSFSEKEINELKEITKDRASVNVFYDKYCLQTNSNPIIHRINVQKICKKISNYQSLL